MSDFRQAGGIAKLLIGLVAAIHIVFAIAEMFLWRSVLARRLLPDLEGMTPEVQAPVLEYTGRFAINMGLYNAFLAVGLLYASRNPGDARNRSVARLFLVFIVVAGAVGGATVSWTIVLVQSIPAVVALAALQYFRQQD